MANQYSQSNKEIIKIKKGSNPVKIFDEGDSLRIGSEIYSFYWYTDVYKPHDYEPIAINKSQQYCMTRLHYNTLIVWQDYSEKEGSPIAFFRAGFHTPMLCTSQKPYFIKENFDIKTRIILNYYFLPKLRDNKSNESYDLENYHKRIVETEVPDSHKFNWDEIKYLIVVSKGGLSSLIMNEKIKKRLSKIWTS